MDVDPNNGAPCAGGHSQRGPARTAGNVKNPLSTGKIEPGQKRIKLASGQPAVLPDILPKRLAANIGVELRLKVPVIGVVVNACLRACRFRST
jgi:hypothetical protein